ncbi:MAG TPA: hypothetical protein VGN44_09515 [Candidatus Angelobacter sp.]|jgi:hypothetical protein
MFLALPCFAQDQASQPPQQPQPAQQQAQVIQPLPDNLNLLIGKKVVIGRMPLCVPKTFNTNLTYSGKTATVVSMKPPNVQKLPPSIMNRMAPDMREKLLDLHNGGLLLFQFEDGTQLDTCAAIGQKALSENMELAPGETIASSAQPGATPASSSQPVMAATTAGTSTSPAASTTSQECPVVVTKVTSGSGGFGHALAEGMTTSEFQRQLDQTEHGGHAKHYLDMRMRNSSSKPIAAIESVVVYSNKMGDETTHDTLLSQNTKPIKPGEELKSYSMDRSESTQNGTGNVTLYIGRVRFEDNSFWQDNGSHSCSLSNKVK